MRFWMVVAVWLSGCVSSEVSDTDSGSADTDAAGDSSDTASEDTDDTASEDTSSEDTSAETDAFGLVGDPSSGSSLYANTCSLCHGAMGGGGIGPSLVDAVAELEKDQVANIIRNGTGDMEGFSTADLSNQDVADIVAHMYASFD